MSGLTPEERYANHKAGTKAASVVKPTAAATWGVHKTKPS
jgi:hypothetical protein